MEIIFISAGLNLIAAFFVYKVLRIYRKEEKAKGIPFSLPTYIARAFPLWIGLIALLIMVERACRLVSSS